MSEILVVPNFVNSLEELNQWLAYLPPQRAQEQRLSYPFTLSSLEVKELYPSLSAILKPLVGKSIDCGVISKGFQYVLPDTFRNCSFLYTVGLETDVVNYRGIPKLKLCFSFWVDKILTREELVSYVKSQVDFNLGEYYV